MAAKKKKKKRIDWNKIETEYCTTEIGQRALAEKYNVSVGSINAHAVKGKWAEKKAQNLNEIQTVVERETKKAIIDEKVEINKQHIALYNRGLGVINFLLEQYEEEIPKIKEGKLKKGRMSACNLDFIMSAITKAQKGQRLALNIDKEDVGDNAEPEIAVVEGITLDKI